MNSPSEAIPPLELEVREELITLSQVGLTDDPVRRVDGRYFTRLEGISHWEQTPTGIRLHVSEHVAEIDIVDPDVFRIRVALKDASPAAPGYAVVRDRSTWHSDFRIEDSETEIAILTDLMRVAIHKSTFRMEARRADGSSILECPSEDKLGSYAFLNDQFIVSRKRSEADLILGLGQKTGRMDRSERSLILWNTDVLNPRSVKEFTSDFKPGDSRADPKGQEFDPYYISIPFYQSLDLQGRASGFFIDNLYRSEFDFSQEGLTRILFAGGEYVEYVFAGPDLSRVLERYTEITGRLKPPPLWSLGYHHCRWHPYSEKDVRNHAEAYRFRGIPCDSIWLDIDHMQGYRVFTWNKRLFPNPAETLAKLADLKFRAVTIVDPGVKVEPGYAVYDSGLERGAFCLTDQGSVYQGQVWPGRTAFPDFASETAREWWGELNAKHIQNGLSGIWNDMNEPATGDIPDHAMRFDKGKYPHGAYHNAYALLMAMGTHEGLKKALPNMRPFILSRAGSAGIQRYAANWLGDNMSRWEHLAMSVPMSLGLGLSGQPFIGADIGGFGENCEPELLIRWIQAACLSPFCRNHNDAGGIDQYPWSFGPETEALCKSALELRYRLMPYIYEAFIQASETGMPIMRPMAFENSNDRTVAEVEDQYLLGRNLLVAPVVGRGERERLVRFSDGEWFDWWSARSVMGSTSIVSAPLSQIPLFARAGAVIPMWPEAPPSTMDYHPSSLDLVVFVPSRDGTYVSRLVEDDGVTHGYESGERLTTAFKLMRSGDTLRLSARTEGRAYPGFRRAGFKILLKGAAAPFEQEVEAGLTGFDWSCRLS